MDKDIEYLLIHQYGYTYDELEQLINNGFNLEEIYDEELKIEQNKATYEVTLQDIVKQFDVFNEESKVYKINKKTFKIDGNTLVCRLYDDRRDEKNTGYIMLYKFIIRENNGDFVITLHKINNKLSDRQNLIYKKELTPFFHVDVIDAMLRMTKRL